MPKSKDAMLCEHANECPVQCPCSSDCYCKKHTCKPRKKSKGKKFTVKVRVYMAAYEDSKDKQGVELTMKFPRKPKSAHDGIRIIQQIQEAAHECLAVRVKYPGEDWKPFGEGKA